jgi:hypothetical protein
MPTLWLREDLMSRLLPRSLFLRADLFKAGGTTVKEEDEPSAPEPKGISDKPPAGETSIHAPIKQSNPTAAFQGMIKKEEGVNPKKLQTWDRMRQKQTHAGDADRKTRRKEMDYAGDVWNKPEYACKKCHTLVVPPKKLKTSSLEEAGAHVARGGEYLGKKDEMHHVDVPPAIASAATKGKLHQLPHGSVEIEHVNSKLCPGCYGKHKASKSLNLIDSLLSLSKSERIPDEDSESLSKKYSTVSGEISHLVKDKGKINKSIGLFIRLEGEV